jgi:hypothetical protein
MCGTSVYWKYVRNVYFNIHVASSVFKCRLFTRLYVISVDTYQSLEAAVGRRKGGGRLKIPHKSHTLNRPNIFTYIPRNTDRFAKPRPSALLRVVFNIFVYSALKPYSYYFDVLTQLKIPTYLRAFLLQLCPSQWTRKPTHHPHNVV